MKRKESGDQGEAFAARYLESLGGEDCPARFDVAEVFEETGGVLRIEYLENAFE